MPFLINRASHGGIGFLADRGRDRSLFPRAKNPNTGFFV
jgi:hypothetical protein